MPDAGERARRPPRRRLLHGSALTAAMKVGFASITPKAGFEASEAKALLRARSANAAGLFVIAFMAAGLWANAEKAVGLAAMTAATCGFGRHDRGRLAVHRTGQTGRVVGEAGRRDSGLEGGGALSGRGEALWVGRHRREQLRVRQLL